MKFHQKNTSIERYGIHAESAFTIKTTAKSFEILSSGLYTDPITAIIRELSCNAYDSHVAAGKKDVPFTIHIPNSLEPYFSVIDYGVGLSDEQIRGESIPVMVENNEGKLVQSVDENNELMFQRVGGLYTTYFDSTKTDSNDFIGALGLGSKSPFSYTNAFEVIACYNGVKRMYSIFLNESGIPSVALLHESETVDSNGIEVKLPIKKEDMIEFKNKTADALRYFPVKPDVIGYHGFKFKKLPEKRLDGEDWFVANDGWEHEHFTAVQGNVPYRVNINQISEYLNDFETKFLKNASVVAFFDIGELDIAANREEIRYDEKTKNNIIKKVSHICESLTKEIERHIPVDLTSYWDACVILNIISRNIFDYDRAILALSKVDNITNDLFKRYINQNNKVCVPSNLKHHSVVKYSKVSTYSSNSERYNREELNEYTTITPSKRTVVFYNDASIGSVANIKRYVTESGYSAAIVIFPKKRTKLTDQEKQDQQAEYDNIVYELGNPEILLVSENTKKVDNKKISVPVFKYIDTKVIRQSYYSNKVVINWEKLQYDDLDLSQGKLYFKLHGGHTIMTGNTGIGWHAHDTKFNFSLMLQAINDHFNTEYTMDDVYGMSAVAYKKIKKVDGWLDIFDLFFETIPNYTPEIIHHTKLYNTANVLSFKEGILKNNNFIEGIFNLPSHSKFKSKFEPIIVNEEKFNKMSKIAKLIIDLKQRYGVQLDVTTSDEQYLTSSDFDDYPMLHIVGSLSNFLHNEHELFNYITLIEENNYENVCIS